MESGYLNIDEASAYTGIKKSTLYAMVERKEVPHYRLGRPIRFKKGDLDIWMEAHRVECVDANEEARRILETTRRSNVDIDSLIKKSIEESVGNRYTSSHEGTRPKSRASERKEVNHGAL